MANTLYPSFKVKLLNGEIDMDSDTIQIAMLGAGYTFNSSHEYRDELTAVLGTPSTLTGATIWPNGAFDADDLAYPDVALGETVRSMVIFKNSGTPASSPLIGFMDTEDDGTPINRVGDGAPIPILWPSIAARIFRI